MLVEFVPEKSTSLVALNSLGRNLFACIGGIVTQPLIAAIGTGWLFTAVGVIDVAGAFVIFAIRRYGPRWRDSMAVTISNS